MRITAQSGEAKRRQELYHNIGCAYDKLGEYDLALQSFSTSIALAEETNDWTIALFSYNNIGVILEKRGKYQDAIDVYFAAMTKMNAKLGKKERFFNEHQNLGNAYLH